MFHKQHLKKCLAVYNLLHFMLHTVPLLVKFIRTLNTLPTFVSNRASDSSILCPGNSLSTEKKLIKMVALKLTTKKSHQEQ